ncbi:MAG: hypothetical protein PVI07_01625 [Anaerolineae bacterium]|jgi:hypothetical protein
MRTHSGPGSEHKPILDFARKQLAAEKFDWGLLLALALGLFAALPFLARAGLPHHTDAELHLYRAAELGHVIREGVLYPRWAPDLYLGYGYPIFNYYAPLTYYLSNLFDLVLPTVDIVGGVKGVFVLGLLLASLGTYLLGRQLFEPAAGLLGAAAFTFSPYVLFIDPHARGDLAEHFAICLLPLTFYSFHQLMCSPARGTLLASILSLAALVFSHNLLGLTASALLLAYWVWRFLLGTQRRRTLWALLAFALAAALLALFWLPALLERDAIKLQVIGPGHFDFRQHFLSLDELLAPSRLLDWGATGPRYRHNLGVPQWLLALPALITLARRFNRPQRGGENRSLGFFFVAALALIFLMLPPSTGVWELVPAMPYLQFPWRLLGPTNFVLAICTASGVTLLPRKPWRWPAIAGAAALTVLMAVPLLYPAPWSPQFGSTTPADIIEWERRSQALGTTSTGDFLPVTVEMVPPPMNTLIQSYSAPGPVDKVNRSVVPAGAQVTIVEHGPLHDRFRVATPKAFRLRLYTFYFPGWRAYLDGAEVDIEVARPEGFVTLDVPQGEHSVLVRFEDTLPRQVGWIISAGAFVVLIVVGVLYPNPQDRDRSATGRKLRPAASLWLGGAFAVLAVFRLVAPAVTASPDLLHYTSPPGQAWPAQHTLQISFEGKIQLLGYDLPRRQVRPGESLSVVLYWHALTDLEENYQSFVHLAQPLDVAWAQEDHLNPGGLPTTRWPVDRYIWDEYTIYVPPQTPPGEYKVNIGLYLRSSGYRLQRQDVDRQGVTDSVVIASIEVVGQPR